MAAIFGMAIGSGKIVMLGKTGWKKKTIT